MLNFIGGLRIVFIDGEDGACDLTGSLCKGTQHVFSELCPKQGSITWLAQKLSQTHPHDVTVNSFDYIICIATLFHSL